MSKLPYMTATIRSPTQQKFKSPQVRRTLPRGNFADADTIHTRWQDVLPDIQLLKTSSSAVLERPCNASCPSVVSLNKIITHTESSIIVI